MGGFNLSFNVCLPVTESCSLESAQYRLYLTLLQGVVGLAGPQPPGLLVSPWSCCPRQSSSFKYSKFYREGSEGSQINSIKK